jgi:hypothetical protein
MIYAHHASAAFNARLDATLQRLVTDIGQAVGPGLLAVILGGGYGRGEGGVVWVDGQECPYNDLDLTLVLTHRGRLPQAALAALRERYSRELGIEVDVGRPLTPDDIRSWPAKLMWFDLLHGHLVLRGPADLLQTLAPECLRRPLPAIEATHLLLNRGAGLLWAARVEAGLAAPTDPDFVRRNLYKCALALGDALLLAHGRFTTPYAGRDRLLAELLAGPPLPVPGGLLPLYEQALRFKFRPDEVPAQAPDAAALRTMAQQWGQVLLAVEAQRTGRTWSGLGDYVAWRGVREQAENGLRRWSRNLLRNGRLGRLSWRHPRERLYRELPSLLGLTGATMADWPERSAAFLRVWSRCN